MNWTTDMTAREMWDEYAIQRLALPCERERARQVFTLEWRLGLSLTVCCRETRRALFRVTSLAWDDPGDPGHRARESWVFGHETRADLDLDWERHVARLVVLYSTPTWTPMWALRYDPSVAGTPPRAGLAGNFRPALLARHAEGDWAALPGLPRWVRPDVARLEPAPWLGEAAVAADVRGDDE